MFEYAENIQKPDQVSKANSQGPSLLLKKCCFKLMFGWDHDGVKRYAKPPTGFVQIKEVMDHSNSQG